MIICHVPIKLFKGQLTLVHFFHLKFRYSEKATKFEEIFHLTYDGTEYKWKIFFQIFALLRISVEQIGQKLSNICSFASKLCSTSNEIFFHEIN